MRKLLIVLMILSTIGGVVCAILGLTYNAGNFSLTSLILGVILLLDGLYQKLDMITTLLLLLVDTKKPDGNNKE